MKRQQYDDTTRRIVVMLALEGETYKALSAEYGVSANTISKWVRTWLDDVGLIKKSEIPKQTTIIESLPPREDSRVLKENRRLRDKVVDLTLEIDDLRKKQ